MVSPAAGLTAIKTIPTLELILIVGMVLYIDNEFYIIQILESFYVEIIIFPVIFDGQTPMWSWEKVPKKKDSGRNDRSLLFRNLY